VRGLAAYAEHLPDWVLVDIRMRKTDGLAVTSRPKQRFAMPESWEGEKKPQRLEDTKEHKE